MRVGPQCFSSAFSSALETLIVKKSSNNNNHGTSLLWFLAFSKVLLTHDLTTLLHVILGGAGVVLPVTRVERSGSEEAGH